MYTRLWHFFSAETSLLVQENCVENHIGSCHTSAHIYQYQVLLEKGLKISSLGSSSTPDIFPLPSSFKDNLFQNLNIQHADAQNMIRLFTGISVSCFKTCHFYSFQALSVLLHTLMTTWQHSHFKLFFFFFPTSHGIMQEIIGFSWYQFLIQYKELWNRCQYSEIICYVHNKSSKFLLCLWNSLAEYILLSTIWVSQNEYFLTTHCSPSLWGDSRWCDYIFTMR